MMKILLIDDHEIMREGLKRILKAEFFSAEITDASDAKNLLSEITNTDFDIIISDLSMPGRSGIDVVKQVKLTKPKIPVLILSMHPEEQYAIRALRAGASGYLNKSSSSSELINAVHKILSGRKYISPEIAEKLLEEGLYPNNEALPHQLLSDRELHIFKLIAEGKTITDIGEQLSLGVTTVSTHRSRILTKMNMKSNADLTRYAIQNELI
ncbi:MAG: response regulator transcription factor [Bacteroidetes bacterium]|nr:response regulator transcription factor [Bacteroidota bacterium]